MAAATGDSSSSTDNNTEHAEFLECILCYENDDLKRLPCSPGHIFCVTCLTKDSEQTKIILCPACKMVFEDTVDALPSATAPIDEFNCCDVCKRKDEKFKYAQVYCVICAKKFCDSHLKSHNDALDDHRRIPMMEYQKEYRKLETRYCVKHSQYQYSLGCKQCYAVYCVECMAGSGSCTDGSIHTVIPLDKLAAALIEVINHKKVWVFDKEESFLEVEKTLTNELSEFDDKTDEMIVKLHQARDRQLDEIRDQYAELERQLINLRTESKIEKTQVLDDEVGKNLNKLSRQLLKINSRVYSHHQVDVVKGFKDTEKLVDELTAMTIKICKPENDVKLVENRKAESRMPLFKLETGCRTPPTSLKFVKSVVIQGSPISVCYHQEYTYAGLGHPVNAVSRIHPDGRVDNAFITLSGRGCCVRVHNEELFVLTDCPAFTILKYNISGGLLTSMKVELQGCIVSKFAVLEDGKVLYADQVRKRFALLDGELTYCGRIIQSPCINSGMMCLAMMDMDSVIISSESASLISRVNLKDGKALWTSEIVHQPLGVTCYKGRYVLATNGNADCKIWILDVNSGNLVGEISTPDRRQSTRRYDLEVYGDQLLVTNHASKAIKYYQIS